MKHRRWRSILVLFAILTLVAAACGDDGGDAGSGDGGTTGETTAAGETSAGGETAAGDDLLAKIQEEGVITVSTDPAYPPQSSLNEETGEYEGFDIDTALEIGRASCRERVCWIV